MTASGGDRGSRAPCEKCGERHAAAGDPGLCAQCRRSREKSRQYSRDHRARKRALATGPPESVALGADATVCFVAAFQVLDAARERLHATDRLVRNDGGRDPSLSRHLADAALAMADAYDDAMSLLRLAMPAGVLPPRNGPRDRVSEASRGAIGLGGRIGTKGERRI